MVRCKPALALALLAMLGGCTTTRKPGPTDPVGSALEQPFRDLSMIQETAPEELKRDAAEPYRPGAGCDAAASEIAQLDTLLGPDLDAAPNGKRGEALAGALMGDATSLPFRGVIRQITGAEARDRAVAAAVLGGIARRAFLRGERAAMGCAVVEAHQ